MIQIHKNCFDIIEQLCNRDKHKCKETQNLRGSPTLCWLRPRAETENRCYLDCFRITELCALLLYK